MQAFRPAASIDSTGARRFRHDPYSFDGSASFSKSQDRIALAINAANPPGTGVATIPANPPPPPTLASADRVVPEVPEAEDGDDFDVQSNATESCEHDEHGDQHQPQRPAGTPLPSAPPPRDEPTSPSGKSTDRLRLSDSNAFTAEDMNEMLTSAQTPIDAPCSPGAVVTVYNGDVSQHFLIPSEYLRVTRGVIKYADHQAKFGQHTRFRFQLCNNFLHGRCPRLSECSYIHTTVLPRPSEVHLNPFAPRRGGGAHRHGPSPDGVLSPQDDPAVADAYETLPPGFTVPVFPPNDSGTLEPQLIPSHMIILTAGAATARRWTAGSTTPSGVGKSRHCAHFQFKRLCHMGTQCHFIHSKIPFL